MRNLEGFLLSLRPKARGKQRRRCKCAQDSTAPRQEHDDLPQISFFSLVDATRER